MTALASSATASRAAGTSTTGRPRRIRPRYDRAAYVFMTPWFIGFVVITAGPLLASLYLSFTDFNLLQAPNWIGFANYTTMLTLDPRFWQSFGVTIAYVVVTVPLQLAFALLIAVALSRKIRGTSWYRSIYYLPSLLGGSVAIAVVWGQIFNKRGIANGILALFGIHGPSWTGDPSTALATLILLNVWQFGAPMVIFLAGIKQIPGELYDAASVDGAGAWNRFRFVTLPMLTPIIFFNLVLQIIRAFQAFTPAYIISGGTGGPSDSTLFYTLYLYQQAFTNLHMGYASALAWVLLVVIAVFTAGNFLLSRFWVTYEN
jgi:multiple sugar transport system permease protein